MNNTKNTTAAPAKIVAEAGYNIDIRISDEAGTLITPTIKEDDFGQSFEGRLWDVLHMSRGAARRAMGAPGTPQPFDVVFLLCSDRDDVKRRGHKMRRLTVTFDGECLVLGV